MSLDAVSFSHNSKSSSSNMYNFSIKIYLNLKDFLTLNVFMHSVFLVCLPTSFGEHQMYRK